MKQEITASKNEQKREAVGETVNDMAVVELLSIAVLGCGNGNFRQ